MKRIGLVIFPGCQVLDLVVATVFELANGESDRPVYKIEVLSENGGEVLSSAGVQVGSEAFGDPTFDTLLVAGSSDMGFEATPALTTFKTLCPPAAESAAFAPARFCWPRRVCSMAAAPPRTGISPAIYSDGFRV